ncbi:MAG: hypothetical protein KY453_00610, partial [Gemmatimonadetes bacterium]|nr:hypothetical protein [Gemmatimonadota bacterium]
MFFALLMATLVGALVHYRFGPAPAGGRTRGRLGELLLVWVLVGYCGIPMVGVAAGALVWPEPTAAMLNLPTGGVFQAFMAGA